MRKNLLIGSLAVILVTGLSGLSVALAQAPGPGPAAFGPAGGGLGGPGRARDGVLHHLRFLARKLELTEVQRDELRVILETERENLAPTREALRVTREELHSLIQSGATQQEIESVGAELGILQAQMGIARENLRQAFRGLLTAQQLEKLDQIQELRGDRDHSRGGRRAGLGGRNFRN